MPAPEPAAPEPAAVAANPAHSTEAASLDRLPPSPAASESERPSAAAQTNPAQAHAETAHFTESRTPPTLSPNDELILELRLRNGAIADTLVAYGTRAGVYLPLGALARTLDLAISVDPDGQRADGWFLSEDRTLTIDLASATLSVRGQAVPIAPDRIVAFHGEMYVRDDYLSAFLPLTLSTDLRDQAVSIFPKEPFPFEQRLAREEKRARLANDANTARDTIDLPHEETPWRALDFPMADVELRALSDTGFGPRSEADVRLTSDFAYMTGQLFASGSTRQGLVSARYELGRRDPAGGLLGPLDATQFALGDVATTALPLGLRGTSGRGLFVTNSPLQQASIFEKIDLRGELPDGYEVELYRNNVLVGSTRQAVNGRFEFVQVPVEFGLNVMRLAFYGPQGQRRDEVRMVTVADGRVPAGKLVYNLALAEKDRSLFGVYGPNYLRTREFGKLRATAQLAYGLSSGITVSLNGARFGTGLAEPDEQDTRWQYGAGLRSGIGKISLRADAALQTAAVSGRASGKAIELGIGTKLFGAAATLEHAEYRGGFVDELRTYAGEALRSASEFSLTGTVTFGGNGGGVSFPYAGRARRLRFADGREQRTASLRTSARLASVLVAAALEYQDYRSPGFANIQRLTGTVDLGRSLGERTQTRLGLGYEVLPGLKPVSAYLELDHALDPRTLLKGSLARSFNAGQTSLGLSAIRRFHRFTLGLDSTLTVPKRQYSVGLRVGFSFGHNPLTERTFVDHPGLAGSGALALRAFRDFDGDGHYGPGDVVLPEVAFGSGAGKVQTDSNGIALIGDLPDGDRTQVVVDPDSLGDIALAPRDPGIAFLPRPGRIHVAEFPVVEVTEIYGTVSFHRDDNNDDRPMSGIRLELIDGHGKVIGYARTGGDGAYFFEQVPPGEYRIRLESEQASRFGLTIREDAVVSVTQGKTTPAIAIAVTKSK